MRAKASEAAELSRALRDVFVSPNEADRNCEPANVVDGLFAIARAIDRLARAVEGSRDAVERD